MMKAGSYRKAFIAAIFLHFTLLLGLLFDKTNEHPIAIERAQIDSVTQESRSSSQSEIIQAVSVDSEAVKQTISRLREERANQIKAEQSRQENLAKQAEMARLSRQLEQERLRALREEAKKLAVARKLQFETEQRRLSQLSKQKEEESKRIRALKRKQQELQNAQQEATNKLLQIQQQQIAESAKLVEKKRQQAQEQAAHDEALKKARIASEVDKYKAMIINAISRQWILPESANNNLSSQFRIRLGANGAVIDVNLTRSSGDPILDRSAQTAIYKAAPLPVPADPEIFNLFRDISLTVRPENVRG